MKEERDVAATNSWVTDPVARIIGELEASLKKYPPIRVGTPDSHVPASEMQSAMAGPGRERPRSEIRAKWRLARHDPDQDA